jgi:hypothetical protein
MSPETAARRQPDPRHRHRAGPASSRPRREQRERAEITGGRGARCAWGTPPPHPTAGPSQHPADDLRTEESHDGAQQAERPGRRLLTSHSESPKITLLAPEKAAVAAPSRHALQYRAPRTPLGRCRVPARRIRGAPLPRTILTPSLYALHPRHPRTASNRTHSHPRARRSAAGVPSLESRPWISLS